MWCGDQVPIVELRRILHMKCGDRAPIVKWSTAFGWFVYGDSLSKEDFIGQLLAHTTDTTPSPNLRQRPMESSHRTVLSGTLQTPSMMSDQPATSECRHRILQRRLNLNCISQDPESLATPGNQLLQDSRAWDGSIRDTVDSTSTATRYGLPVDAHAETACPKRTFLELTRYLL